MDVLNIDGRPIEERIIDAIDITRYELRDLTTDQTCKFYSSHLKEVLNNMHLINRIVNTADYNLPYEHQFNLVMGDENTYYLIDLTYRQFMNIAYPELLFAGYMRVDDNMFNDYLELIGNGYIESSLEEVFSGNEKKK